jgi:hypothetical protein
VFAVQTQGKALRAAARFDELPQRRLVGGKSSRLKLPVHLGAASIGHHAAAQHHGIAGELPGLLFAHRQQLVNQLVEHAAASLVSVFCNYLAVAEKEGKKADYAEALLEAKRWARRQEKWASPYYWGTFVLTGPD